MKRTIAALALSALAAPLLAALPEPVTHFSFDELKSPGTIANLADPGRDLTLGAGASVTNFGAVGNAIWFDGTTDAYATFQSPSITNRTVSFWLYRSSDPGPYYAANYADDGNKNPRMPTMIAGLNTFHFRFNNGWASNDDHSRGVGDHNMIAYFGTGGSLGACYMSYMKYPNVNEERWVHFAYTFAFTGSEPTGGGADHCDTFDCDIYVNGEKWYAGKGLAATNCFPSQAACIGNNNKNGLRPCCGALDELKVFGEALTEEQVREEFARGRDALRHRLVTWYPMREFSAPDGSGNYTTPDCTAYGLDRGRTMTCSAATSVAPGPNGTDKAIHFDGTQTTHAFGKLPYTVDDFTIALWVNVSTNTSILRVPGQTANYPKMLKVGNFSAYFDWGITSTKMQFVLPSVQGGSGGIHTFSVNGTTGKGNWQHLTLVVRNVRTSIDTVANAYNQHLELYLNGEFAQKSVDVAGARTGLDAALILGSDSDISSTRPFEGEISDFRLYDGAMTADEVRRLFRGAADVDAGADAVVKGPRAALCGTVKPQSSAEKIRFGYAGKVSWSLVSAPAGGEGAEFLRPANPVTEVTLPVEGTYVFKLAATGFLGAASEDTVTVVRDDAQGAASVVPAVDAEAVASNAAVRATLSDGLIRHWNFNGLVRKDEVSGRVSTAKVNNNDYLVDWSKAQIGEGVSGNGVGVLPGVRGSAFTANLASGETRDQYGIGCQPDNEWLTVSAWIKPSADYPNDWFAGAICHLPLTLSVCYGKYYSPGAATGPIAGMSILQTGVKGYQAYLNYDLPAGADPVGKWNHVVALVNRWTTTQCEMYLNGVKLNEDTAHRSAGNYGNFEEPGYAPFSGKPCGGRDNGEGVCFGNVQNELGGSNNTIFQASNTATGIAYSRHFPGVIDEVRFYNRKLTEAEIAYLFAHPDPNANDAPTVGKAEVGPDAIVVTKKQQTASAAAADDGNPADALTYEWVVLKGDAANVQIADPAARETQVKFLKKGEYALALKVSDGERVTWGEPKEVTVNACGMMLILR